MKFSHPTPISIISPDFEESFHPKEPRASTSPPKESHERTLNFRAFQTLQVFSPLLVRRVSGEGFGEGNEPFVASENMPEECQSWEERKRKPVKDKVVCSSEGSLNVGAGKGALTFLLLH